jgi:hypothetical protein
MEVDRALRAEADQLLGGGLYDTLASYGTVHVVGSYALELMVWRDLDIHLVPEELDREAFFELGGRIAEILTPHRMQFRDERDVRTDGLPAGFYWGVYLGDERAGAWKLDLWATDERGLNRVQTYCHSIRQRLSPQARDRILKIKGECWQQPGYRKRFGSADVYEAVLEHGVEDVAGFQHFLGERE